MKLLGARPDLDAYEAVKRRVTANIVKRFSRGNVNVQNGFSSTREKLLAESREADAKAKNLKKMVEAS